MTVTRAGQVRVHCPGAASLSDTLFDLQDTPQDLDAKLKMIGNEVFGLSPRPARAVAHGLCISVGSTCGICRGGHRIARGGGGGRCIRRGHMGPGHVARAPFVPSERAPPPPPRATEGESQGVARYAVAQ